VPSQFKEPGERICLKAQVAGVLRRIAVPASWHIAIRSLKFA